jgi:NAD(P)-dependent dehydrogenase (short-subunit alcohol dehydrogenase family)
MPKPDLPFRYDLFEGKTALVTGGGTGLGKEFARGLAALGADVMICSRDEEHLRPTAQAISKESGRGVEFMACDVRKPEQVDAVVESVVTKFGHLDVLINNAAGNFFAPVESMSFNAWKAVVDIVLHGTFLMSKAAFEPLKKSKGNIVNIVATYADGAAPFVAHSGASKAGVLNLTRSLALEWAAHGIRVNAVAPGFVPTVGVKANLFPDPAIEKEALNAIPLGRFGEPQEIANAVLFLASSAASYVTGALFEVDAGQGLAGNPFYSIGSRLR